MKNLYFLPLWNIFQPPLLCKRIKEVCVGASSSAAEIGDGKSEILRILSELEFGLGERNVILGKDTRGASYVVIAYDLIGTRALDIHVAVLNVELVDFGSLGRIEVTVFKSACYRSIFKVFSLYYGEGAAGIGAS